MTATPTISCVVLCHNYGRYLERALRSCLTQEPGDYRLEELIVIDDGSTDETPDVCARWAAKVKVVRRDRRGFAATLTDAVRLSRGDWIALLDADDWFEPAKLRTCAPHMMPPTLLIQHWEHVVDPDGQPLLDTPHPGGNTSTLVFNRDAVQPLLPVTNEIFFHALRETGHGIELFDPLTRYRVHPLSFTDRQNPGVSQDYRAQVALEIADRLAELCATPPPWATRGQLRRARAVFTALAGQHHVEAAIQRGSRTRALPGLGRMVLDTIRVRRSLRPCLTSLVSLATGVPRVRLGDPRAGNGPDGQSPDVGSAGS